MTKEEISKEIEKIAGSSQGAEKLKYLWSISSRYDMRPKGRLFTKNYVFKRKSLISGFNKEQIKSFIKLMQ
jgi:hypothetical protein